MANTKIKILRGLKKDLPLLDRGEIAFCTDTKELFAGDGEKNLLLSGGGGGGEVDLNIMAYFNYAGRFYGDKHSLFLDAWERSLIVDPLEISEDGSYSNPRGKAQYPNGETEGVIIPQGVTSIGNQAFYNWLANNQPLVIPDSVTSIGIAALSDWISNNQPLTIPNSVTSIGEGAFSGWSSNTHPLVIPDSVTSIGEGAFSGWELVPYVEMRAITPPTLIDANAFGNQNDAPIYVPDERVDDYKEATNWVELADRIFPMSDKAVVIGDIKNTLDAILGV
jgi:hypothetical protein